MTVSPLDVKKIRNKTGAGMLDCKNALLKAKGDTALAEKILKEQGLASADNRVGRATNNGAVFSEITTKRAALIELMCETDFVAKNAVFSKTGKQIASAVVTSGSTEKTDKLITIVKESIAVLKENMLLGKLFCWDITEKEFVLDYLHNGGQIGSMVKLRCDSANSVSKEALKNLAFDIALHVAAYNPPYLNEEAVSPAYRKEQEEIFRAQANNLGNKPEKVIQNIVKGKLEKHWVQICLLKQKFVKDDKKSVQQIIEELAKKEGGSIELIDYAYIAVGQENETSAL